eukprot:CAMPEP_0196661242 /NCGR_PEP_ID=MMETSP1086-20130531/43379_1 /TAXON_ID=77921 /ORGANISM="Cyanoptyche  gloeocystis , Strain SAG4.97" /LENGTH=123 /DNA_ID=CAMNT_0041996049 /DNA_START=473 /DNA_END=840 /DNA_ORIENTATION=-
MNRLPTFPEGSCPSAARTAYTGASSLPAPPCLRPGHAPCQTGPPDAIEMDQRMYLWMIYAVLEGWRLVTWALAGFKLGSAMNEAYQVNRCCYAKSNEKWTHGDKLGVWVEARQENEKIREEDG